MNSNKALWILLGVLALTALGFVFIPPLLKKYSNKLYKASSKKEDIDFDNLGPEIVTKNDTREE